MPGGYPLRASGVRKEHVDYRLEPSALGGDAPSATRSCVRRISLKTRRIKIGTFLQYSLDRSRVQSDSWSCKETSRWHGPRSRARRPRRPDSRLRSRTTPSWGWRSWSRCTPPAATARLGGGQHQRGARDRGKPLRSEEHTSELQSLRHLVCRL